MDCFGMLERMWLIISLHSRLVYFRYSSKWLSGNCLTPLMLNLQEEHISEVLDMQQTTTKSQVVKAFSTFDEANGARKSGIKESWSILQCSGSPQTPDLLFTRSPQLTQERKGAQLPRFQSGSPVPFTFSAKKTNLALPVLEGTELNSLKSSGWAICDKVSQISVPDGTKSETTIHTHDNLGVMSVSCLPSSSQHPVAATNLGQSGITKEGVNTLVDIASKQDPQPFGKHLEVEKECEHLGEDNELEVFVSATGVQIQIDFGSLMFLYSIYNKVEHAITNTAPKTNALKFCTISTYRYKVQHLNITLPCWFWVIYR